MTWFTLQNVLLVIQRSISFTGVMIIFFGVIAAVTQFIYFAMTGQLQKGVKINEVRLNLGRMLILGLEFIVAADLIGTTTTPDYYAVGILAIIVIIRTLLSFTLNREIMSLSKEK